MTLPFPLNGTIGRLPYAAWVLGLFVSEYLLLLAVVGPSGVSLSDYVLYVLGGDWRVDTKGLEGWPYAVVLIYSMVVPWTVCVLSVRRAVDGDVHPAIAVLTLAPIIQFVVMVALFALPPRDPAAVAERVRRAEAIERARRAAAEQARQPAAGSADAEGPAVETGTHPSVYAVALPREPDTAPTVRAMVSPFSFNGAIGRLPYAAWSVGLFASQYLALAVVLGPSHVPWSDQDVYGSPITWLIKNTDVSGWSAVGLVYMVAVAWAVGALSFRRAADADINQAVAILTLIPIMQLVVILCLFLSPPRDPAEVAERARRAEAIERARRAAAEHARQAAAASGEAPEPVVELSKHLVAQAMLGLGGGVGLSVLAVAVSTLIFGAYGYGLFALTPFVTGAMIAYLANKDQDIGSSRTSQLILIALGLAGVALVLVALEGAICIIMVAPLAIGLALLGGAVGRDIASRSRRPARDVWSFVALVPLVFATEYVLPTSTRFETVQSIAVSAPPETVWRSLLSTDPVEGPLALPFRLGLAHPVRGEVIGEGVGAVRRGEFSTGTAIERITEWEPNRRLAFVVVDDIPAMRELSPYEHVHAPHAVGYFRTLHTSFELVRRADGHTDLIERTSHELRLDPVLYWLPMARWVVTENNARVLAHIRRHAEQAVQAAR